MPLQIIGQSPLPLERFASMRTRASACVRACVRRAQGSADSGTLRASCIRIYIYIPLVQVGVAHPRKSPFLWDWCTRRYYDCPFLPPLLSPPLPFSLLLAKKEVVEIVSRILSGFQQISDVRKLERAMERVLEGRWWCYK